MPASSRQDNPHAALRQRATAPDPTFAGLTAETQWRNDCGPRLRRWYEDTPAMLHVLDMQGNIVMVSDLWLSRLGYQREDVLGRHINEFLTAESQAHSDIRVLPRFLDVGLCDAAGFQMVASSGELVDVLISAVIEPEGEAAEGRERQGGERQGGERQGGENRGGSRIEPGNILPFKPAASGLDHGADAGGGWILAVVEDISLRLKAEHDLSAERLRLSNLIEGTQAATLEWNLQTGEARCNERLAWKIGFTLDELAGFDGGGDIQFWRDRTHRGDLARYDQALWEHCAGATGRCECELRMRHRDGSWIWVLERGSVMSRTADGKPEWLFATRLDITARKQQEEALRKSQALLDRTGLLAGIGGWEVDLITGEVHWSRETYRIHGVGVDFRPVFEETMAFYAPEARPVLAAAVGQAVAGEGGWDLELRFIPRCGEAIWVRVVGEAVFADRGDDQGKAVRLTGAIQDVTETHRLIAELAEQHEMLRVTLQSIGDAVLTADAIGNVTWLNPVAERMTGWATSEALGRPASQVFRILNEASRTEGLHPVTLCLAATGLAATGLAATGLAATGLAATGLAETGFAKGPSDQETAAGGDENTLLIARDGTEYGIQNSAAPIRGDNGQILGVVLVFHDVTEERRLSQEISHRASHDALTGLLNRGEFEIQLRDLLHKTHEEYGRSVLLFLDLDQFKVVNDSCGHAQGDQLLCQVATILTSAIRSNDTLARLGGDEFAIILDGCPVAQALALAQRICDRMEEFRFVHDGHRFRIGISIGLVPIDERWFTTAAVLQAADACCYAAKEAGRNRVSIWSDSEDLIVSRHGQTLWVARLEDAIEQDAFRLFAQRYIPLQQQGETPGIHAEVLLRMADSDGRIVPPGAFLPAAERFHMVSRIDRWVLDKVIAWMQSQRDQQSGSHTGLAAIDCLNVNLSGQSVGDRAFHRWAIDVLTEAGPEICRRLCIEITETAAVANLADAALFIQAMRALEVRVALDDFGAGASWFGYLKTMPVDFLKIDGQFIKDFSTDPLNGAAVRCFTDVAKTLHIDTVAEFVEDQTVLDQLRAMGVNYAQGYHVHRPEPIDLLTENRLAQAPTAAS